MNDKKSFFARYKWVIIAAVCLAVLAGALVYGNATYIKVGKQFVRRDATTLDLRGQTVSMEEYRQIRSNLPNCHIVWDVPFQGGFFSSDSKQLQVTTLTADDIAQLENFPQLELLDATGCTDYDMLSIFQACNPDCTVRYDVNVGSETVSWDTQVLLVSDPTVEQLTENLPLLPNLTKVELTGDLPERQQLRDLQKEFPALFISWNVDFQDMTVSSDATELDLSGRTLELEEVKQLIAMLPVLERADFTGSSLTDAEMMTLADLYPQTFFVWEMEVAGLRFSTDSIEIDISGQKVTDTAQVSDVFPYFPKLEKVIMSDCGLDNETMDQFNRAYEDIKIVWTVYIRWYPVRTDALYFYPYKIDPNRFPWKDNFADIELYPLRYCTDMLTIDMGHMGSVSTIEWAAFMPHLRHLIITDTAVSDLTPLENCKELMYFEATRCYYLKDLSPLQHCTALDDLSLGWTYAYPDGLKNMTWLKHLWWCGVNYTTGMPCGEARAMLTEALPGTVQFWDGAHPVDGGWRELQTYADMRDIMDMFYLR